MDLAAEIIDWSFSSILSVLLFLRRMVRWNPNAPLVRGHKIKGRKVEVYETHWVAGLEFLFAIIPWPRENFRIYILKYPSAGFRSGSSSHMHWLPDLSYGAKYICVQVSAYPETLTDARELALMWAQATARYIKTGGEFS